MVGTNQLEWDHLGKLRTFASTEGRLSAGDKARGVVVCFWVESKVLGLVFEGNASSRASSAWHHPPVHRRAAYWREWRMPAHMPVIINIMALHYSAWDLNLETLLYSDASVSM